MKSGAAAKPDRKSPAGKGAVIDDEKQHAKVEALRKIEREFAIALTLPVRKTGKIKKQDPTWKTYKTRWAEVRGNMLIYKESEQVRVFPLH